MSEKKWPTQIGLKMLSQTKVFDEITYREYAGEIYELTATKTFKCKDADERLVKIGIFNSQIHNLGWKITQSYTTSGSEDVFVECEYIDGNYHPEKWRDKVLFKSVCVWDEDEGEFKPIDSFDIKTKTIQ